MTAAKPKRKSTARAPLGFTETVLVKMHPDMKAHVEARADANYTSSAEFIRSLIVADMRLNGEG